MPNNNILVTGSYVCGSFVVRMQIIYILSTQGMLVFVVLEYLYHSYNLAYGPSTKEDMC